MKKTYKQIIAVFLALLLPLQGVGLSSAFAQGLPLGGQSAPSLIVLSPVYTPAILRGIKVDLQNPFRFEFVLDNGQSKLAGDDLKSEGIKLIKYFLASLTLPEQDLWVNLSPYEKDRIVSDEFGRTEMGRQLLSEDFLLKKLSASLLHPDSESGKKFWNKVRATAAKKMGTADIHMSTFNRIWIMPAKAVVYQNQGAAFIGETRLKVLLEEDYKAAMSSPNSNISSPDTNMSFPNASIGNPSDHSSQVFREEVLPIIEKEVNEGQSFASLRQIYHSLILASWYKRTLKQSLLSQIYVDRKKVAGMESDDKGAKEQIYNEYLATFKKGVYNLIREEQDATTGEMIPRKYFSGGVTLLLVGSSQIVETRPLTPATQIPTIGSLTVLDVNTQGFNSTGAASSAVTDEEILAMLESRFASEKIFDQLKALYYRLRQSEFLGEGILKKSYGKTKQEHRNFADGLRRMLFIPKFEETFINISQEKLLDLATLRRAFEANPLSMPSATNLIGKNFAEFHDVVRDLMKNRFVLADLQQYFVKNPLVFVKRVSAFAQFGKAQRALSQEFMAGTGNIQPYLLANNKRLVFEIPDIASLNATEGFLRTFNINSDLKSGERMLIIYHLEAGLTRENIAQRFPNAELREGDRGLPIKDVILAFSDGLDFPEQDSKTTVNRLFLPMKLFKFNLPEPTPESDNEVAAMRQALQLAPGRKVVVTSFLLKDREGLKQLLEAEAQFDAANRPLLILGMREVDEDVRSFIQGYPSLRILERGQKDLTPDGVFNGMAQGQPMGQADVIILNTSGELRKLYALADVVLLGNDRNAGEPVSQKKSFMYLPGEGLNNQEILSYLVAAGVAKEVVGDLYGRLKYSFDHPEEVAASDLLALPAIQKYIVQSSSEARFNTILELVSKIVTDSKAASSTVQLAQRNITDLGINDWLADDLLKHFAQLNEGKSIKFLELQMGVKSPQEKLADLQKAFQPFTDPDEWVAVMIQGDIRRDSGELSPNYFDLVVDQVKNIKETRRLNSLADNTSLNIGVFEFTLAYAYHPDTNTVYFDKISFGKTDALRGQGLMRQTLSQIATNFKELYPNSYIAVMVFSDATRYWINKNFRPVSSQQTDYPSLVGDIFFDLRLNPGEMASPRFMLGVVPVTASSALVNINDDLTYDAKTHRLQKSSTEQEFNNINIVGTNTDVFDIGEGRVIRIPHPTWSIPQEKVDLIRQSGDLGISPVVYEVAKTKDGTLYFEVKKIAGLSLNDHLANSGQGFFNDGELNAIADLLILQIKNKIFIPQTFNFTDIFMSQQDGQPMAYVIDPDSIQTWNGSYRDQAAKYLPLVTNSIRLQQVDPAGKIRKKLADFLAESESPTGALNSVSSSAVDKKVGGIDLRDDNLNLDLRGEAGTFNLPLDAAQIQKIRIDGLVPVILNVTPLPSLSTFIKLSAAESAIPAQISLQN